MTSTAPAGTQAVDRAAALIDLVVRAPEPVSFTELSEETGLARSTTSRLLAALERTDLVERDAAGGYVAGPLFALHAAIHDPWPQVARLARPVLETVGERTGETVHLGVGRGPGVVHIGQVESTFLLVGPRLEPGRRTPALLGARQGALRARPAPDPGGPAGAAHRARPRLPRGAARGVRNGPPPRLRDHPRRARGRAHRDRGARRGQGRGDLRDRHLRPHRAAPGPGRPHRPTPRRAGRTRCRRCSAAPPGTSTHHHPTPHSPSTQEPHHPQSPTTTQSPTKEGAA